MKGHMYKCQSAEMQYPVKKLPISSKFNQDFKCKQTQYNNAKTFPRSYN